MRSARDASGEPVLVLETDGDERLVRDPATDTERWVPADGLSPAAEPPLRTAARAVPEPVRRLLAAVPDDRALGLLVILDGGPRTARELVAATECCESDLHGLLADLRAAGLVAETTVGDVPGYRTTGVAAAGLAAFD